MACACKQKVNQKYLTDEEKLQLELNKMRGLEKIGNVIGQFFFGILITVVMIIGIIPIVGYVAISACTGKDMQFRIPNFYKWFNKK